MADIEADGTRDGASDTIRVLHVDDEPQLAETVAALLEREDERFEVATARDPVVGLDRIAEGAVDCVVADYDLAESDGLTFLEDVRERRPDLPFILFTGEGSEAVASEAFGSGATDYLPKEAGGDRYGALAERIRHAVEDSDDLEAVTSAIGHDLRNPLQVLAGSLDLAEETGDTEHFERARTAVDRMDRLTEDLLALAAEGRQLGDTSQVDVGETARAAWRTVATRDASLDVATDLVVEADEGRLAELLENLFNNAVRHGGPDVTVTVGALADGDGFYVADDGPGIPEESRDAVFDSGYTTADDGTGLGLAIVRDIAAAHGWRVTPAETDAGARFEVAFDGQ